jgi:hypothetical protein
VCYRRCAGVNLDGLVLAKLPGESRERGEWVVYRVNDAAVSELVLRLTQELGET